MNILKSNIKIKIFKIMKNLKITSSSLEIRVAQMPVTSEFKAVKLSYEQAMSFDHLATSFDELVACYGVSSQLKPNEHYEGYIAVPYPWGRVDVICLGGAIQKINPNEAKYCWNTNEAQLIREGKCWHVQWQNSDGSTCPGKFNYVWTFKGCRFAQTITDLQKKGYLPSDMDADATDKLLKDKLVSALCGNKIVKVSDNEDLILKVYLGEYSYYKSFFSEVQ